MFQHFGECRDCVSLHEEESYDLLELVVPPVVLHLPGELL